MTRAPASDGLPMPRRLHAVIALSAGNGLAVLDGGIVNVALPVIARDLHVGNASAVLVVTVYQLLLGMLLLPLSSLGAKIGLARLYQFGQALFGIASLLCLFAHSLPFLLVLRAAQAVGAASVLAVSAALVRAVYPGARLGRGLAFNTLVIASTAAIAPTLGGAVLAVASWPWVFAVAVPLTIMSLLFGRALPNVAPSRRRYDYLSALMSAGTFGLIIGGLESAVHGDSPVVSVALVAAGGIVAVLFVRRERGAPHPIMPVDLLGSAVMKLSIFGALCAFIAQMIVLVSLPFRLSHDFGLSPETIGAMIAPWPAAIIIVAPLAGALSDRWPAGLLGGVGMSVAIVALITLAFLPAHPDFWDMAWRMALCGAGFGLFTSPNARLIIGSAPKSRTASAGGLAATTRLTGQTLGATVASVLLATGFGGEDAPPLIAAGLALVAGICSMARLNPSLRRPDDAEVRRASLPGGG